MTNDLLAFRKKFELDVYTLFESEHWIWSLRPQQVTLGSSILSLKRYADAFSSLDQREGADLVGMIALLEKCKRELLGFQKINYLMLMMNDNLVHFHVLPRYEFKRAYGDREWIDAAWPGPADIAVPQGHASELADLRREIEGWLLNQRQGN